MSSRTPLVIGSDGLPQQLQSGDSLAADMIKNYAINPAMQHAQEFGSAAQTGVTATRWPVDGTMIAIAGTMAFTCQQVAVPTPGGSPYRLRATVTTVDASPAAGDSASFQHRLDGADVADLLLGTSAAKAIQVRFGFKGPAGTYGVRLAASGTARTYTTGFVISAGQANTDTLQTFSVPADTTGTWLSTEGTIGLTVIIALMCGTTGQTSTLNSWTSTATAVAPNTITNNVGTLSNVFEVFDWGIYAGSILPDFQVPDLLHEKLRCQRYFQMYPLAGASAPTTILSTNGASSVISGSVNLEFPLPVPMRVTPTVTFANVANTNCATPTALAAGTDKSKIRFNTTATAAGAVSSVFTWKADAHA